MQNWPLRLVFGVLLALGLAEVAAASAWTLPKGHGQIITTTSLYRSRGGFDDQGQPVPSAQYERVEISSYVEYGLSDRLTIGAEPRHQWASAGSGGAQTRAQAPGDLDLFARYHVLSHGPWTSAFQALAKFPVYSHSLVPAPGNGRREYEARFAIGRNFSVIGVSAFMDAELAYRMGTHGVADQVKSDFTIGLGPIGRFELLLKAYRTTSVGDGDGRAGSYYDLYKAELSGLMRVSRGVSLEFGAGRDLSGNRVGLGHSASIALWLRF
jgi:hypothetical protein